MGKAAWVVKSWLRTPLLVAVRVSALCLPALPTRSVLLSLRSPPLASCPSSLKCHTPGLPLQTLASCVLLDDDQVEEANALRELGHRTLITCLFFLPYKGAYARRFGTETSCVTLRRLCICHSIICGFAEDGLQLENSGRDDSGQGQVWSGDEEDTGLVPANVHGDRRHHRIGHLCLVSVFLHQAS